MTGSPRVFNPSDSSTQNLQQFLSYGSDFPTLALVPAEVSALVSCDSLYLFYSSPIWGLPFTS